MKMIDSNIIPFMRETMDFTAMNNVLGDTFFHLTEKNIVMWSAFAIGPLSRSRKIDGANLEAKSSILQEACIVLVMVSTISTIG
jgi:hypothetical protein